jgi:arylsulfatase A-like enzyme
MGRFGIHTGVVNHGGINADPYPVGINRPFNMHPDYHSFVMALRSKYYTVSVSPFAERHASWWFYSGFHEMYNPGKGGNERADEIFPFAEKWLNENGDNDNWFLHVNMWDPHTCYRTPEDFGSPFINDPIPSWITEEKIQKDFKSFGPHGAHEVSGFGYSEWDKKQGCPAVKDLKDYKKWIDGYDTGIKYADYYISKIVDILKKKGVYEDTAIIISSDHGENQGELNVYGDHQTADLITSRVPFILKIPGVTKPSINKALIYQTDITATILELLGLKIPKKWDGRSYADNILKGTDSARPYIVVSHCAWSCQRSVIFDDWILIKTYHTGLKDFPEIMLFNSKSDPHELNNCAKENPSIVKKGLKLLDKWHKEMMDTSDNGIDPLKTVIKEGGPYHTRFDLKSYSKHLKKTGRVVHAKKLLKFKGKPSSKF